jgi:GT2 family glycosyltransferase/FMN phosphatase YigB (HAD superfamily)
MMPASPLPADLWRNEESLRRAAELIELSAGRVRAVSFDFFDTLVWRLTARPTDVFPEVGRRLKEQQLIPAHVTSADFATLRRVAEGKARQAQHRRDKAVEDVRLDAVYAQMRSLIKDGAMAAKTEVAAESDLCVLNPSMMAFARHARERGLRVVIISDIYLAADALREIIRANHGDPSFFEHIFTSGDCGVCKGTGNLFRAALKALRLKPEELLHLGDHPGADVVGARKAGVRACPYVQGTPTAHSVLARETALLGGNEPAFSINSLRLLAARQFPGETEEAFFARSGALLLGPLLSRFATWACEQFTTSGVRKVGAFMREGDLFGPMLQAEANHQRLPLAIEPLFVNRKSTDLAAIGRLSAENLLDWLGRRETLPVKTILNHFGLAAEQLPGLPFSADERINSPDRLHQLAKHLFTPEIAQPIEARSAEERRKVVDYLRPWLESGAAFGVCDIGYNASAQMQIARILEMEGIRVPMVGCYLVTSERAASRVLDGLDVRHFLGSFGQPDFHFASFIRSPAFVEQSLTAPIGTTLGYQRQSDGSVTPVLDEVRFAPELLRRQRAFKDGVLAYQKLWLWTRAQKAASLDSDSTLAARMLADIDRAGAVILGRASAFPLQAELRHFATIPLDDYYFAEGVKTLCATSDREQWRKGGYAHVIGAQGVLWPQAVHQIESPRSTDDFFSYGRGMLLAGAAEVAEGVPSEITVIVQAGDNLARLEECLTRLKKSATPGRGIEVVAVVGTLTNELKALTLRHTNSVFRVWAVQRLPSDTLTQCLNRQADRSPSTALLFMDDGVRLNRGWDEQVGVSLRNPTTALLFAGEPTSDAFVKSLPLALGRAARCVAVRRSVFVEGLGLSGDLSPAGALWHLAAQLRELNWQASVATPAFADLTGGDSSLPADDLRSLERAHASFAALAANLLGSPVVATPVAEAAPAVAPGKPGTSIIILALNQLEHTHQCLESLAAHTPLPHEIILVDNGSNDGTPEFLREWLAKTPYGSVIRNSTNRGFAAGNNQGLALARGDTVVLLNNDTVVTAGWLERMLGVLDREPDTGVVGPMSNCVSGPQLVSQVGYTDLADLPAFAETWTHQHAGQSFETSRVVGFCLLARRSVLERLGGLDEQFGSGNFEDDDFCLRARLAGFRIRIAQDVFIHHTGGQTFKGARIDYRAAMRRNWELFCAKWRLDGARIEQGYRPPAALPPGVPLHLPIRALAATHHTRDHQLWIETSPTPAASFSGTAEVCVPSHHAARPPACSGLGQLASSRAFLTHQQWQPAWEGTVTAIQQRPFHPEAYLLLAEIAQAAGDGARARRCAERARQLAPDWKPAKRFLKTVRQIGPVRKLAWPGPDESPSNLQAAKPGPAADRSRANVGPSPASTGSPAPPRARTAGDPANPAPRLTVCLITRNEEAFLARCLASIKPVAQEIIVVDTGSTDRTMDIAREFGASVHPFAWCDDFSAARNAALEHATGDWILMLDADEALPAAEHARLLHDMSRKDVLGCRLPLVNVGTDEEGHHFVPRLFRNAPGLFYVGRVHEQVFSSLSVRAKDWGLRTVTGTATIMHYGYTRELTAGRHKIERNLRLLDQAVREVPGDPGLIMNLGLELVRSGRLDEGLARYREAYRIVAAQDPAAVAPELRESLLTQYGVHLLKGEAWNEIIDIVGSASGRATGPTASLHYLLGLALMKASRSEDALAEFRQCLAKRRQTTFFPRLPEVNQVAPRHHIARCLAALGRGEEAEAAFRQALAEYPDALPLRLDWARYLAERNREIEALEELSKLILQSGQTPSVWQVGGQIALAKPNLLDFALEWTGEAVKHLPNDPVLAAQHAEALMLKGEMEAALPFWRLTGPAQEASHLAGLILCELCTDTLEPHALNGATSQVEQQFLRWYQRLVGAGATAPVLAIHERLPGLAPVLPGAVRALEMAMAEAEQ